MPSVTKVKSAHGSARVTQPSHRFFQSAAIAKAKGTESDAKPENMIGGWMTIQGSWSSGFRPTPSSGAGGGRSLNGLCRQRIAMIPRKRREVDDHHRRFQLLRAAPDDQADERAPEAPEQEGALLSAPERRDQEVERQVAARVGVDVGDVEAVLEQQRHEHAGGGHDARREGGVKAARERQQVGAAAVDAQVGERRREPGEERSPDGGHAGPEVGGHGEEPTTAAASWPTL